MALPSPPAFPISVHAPSEARGFAVGATSTEIAYRVISVVQTAGTAAAYLPALAFPVRELGTVAHPVLYAVSVDNSSLVSSRIVRTDNLKDLAAFSAVFRVGRHDTESGLVLAASSL